MSGSEFRFTCLSDQRLAAHALSPQPAWLWNGQATGILWANPTGAAIFNARTLAEIDTLSFDPARQPAAQIARLAETLPLDGAPRLERLRGFGAGVGGALTCQCARLAFNGGTTGILVVSTERAGPELPLTERVQRLLAGCDAAIAAFTADGELIDASPTARERTGGNSLSALGAERLAEAATRYGHAEGTIAEIPATIDRLGAGRVLVLLVTFTPADAKPAPAPVAELPVRNGRVAPAPKTRRHPLRFVWQIDSEGCFTLDSDEFIRLVGPVSAALVGTPWPELAGALDLDPKGEIARALGSRDTWNGIAVPWPVDGDTEPLNLEFSGLPVFDRERNFYGYRGFAICRDVERLDALEQARQSKPPEESATVLRFPTAPAPEKTPELSPGEESAFHELARELGSRLKNPAANAPLPDDFGTEAPLAAEPPPVAREGATTRGSQNEQPILDRLPIGILVYRLNDLLYANRAFLDWTGYDSLQALAQAGGLESLFIETRIDASGKNGGKSLTIAANGGRRKPVEGRLFSVAWNSDSALVLMLNTGVPGASSKESDLALRRIEGENREFKAILDTATDGVVVLDRSGRALSASRSAEALFGHDASEFAALSFGELFAPESRETALDYLAHIARNDASSLVNEGREVIGAVRGGGLIPLYMTVGHVGDGGEKFCAVFRDLTAWKKSEEELINAKRQAEKTSEAKSEFLAKVSHEIRTPLNAIIGFSEVMMDERFGPVGNERYRQYLRDIHASGGHLIALLNDLLDLSKIEAGKLELSFAGVNLNDLAQQCVAVMQQEANRERVIIRTSLPPNLPRIVADARSVRQIVLNLLSNAIKFTGAGGQVIISTARTDDDAVVLRVRDTGDGMSEMELQTALEPFRQLATAARFGSSGSGLGLPITRALAEANRASFAITSAAGDGTLVEIAFPADRQLAQ